MADFQKQLEDLESDQEKQKKMKMKASQELQMNEVSEDLPRTFNLIEECTPMLWYTLKLELFRAYAPCAASALM